MGSLGDDDDDNSPFKSNKGAEFACTESDDDTQIIDSQFTPPPSPGGYADELQCVQNTVVYDDTVPLDDNFETQVVNLCGETQVFDDFDYMENMETQLVDEYDDEIAADSEDIGSDGTEVLGDNDLFDDDCEKEIGGWADDGVRMQNSSHCEHTNMRLQEKGDVSTGEIPLMRDLPRIEDKDVHKHDMETHSEKPNESRNQTNSRIGCSTVRKLFMENLLSEERGSEHNGQSADSEEDLPAGFGVMAGLSYINSQEPGDLSQANALNFVDNFLENVMELDNEPNHVRTTGGKSNYLLSAKGPQSLACRSHDRHTVKEVEIFDWDDNREDEGGGDIFCRRKEEFFNSGSSGRKSAPRYRKPKDRKEDSQEKERKSRIHDTVLGLIHSDSRLVLKSEKKRKVALAVEAKPRKNLVSEFDVHSNINSSQGRISNIYVPEMLDVGFDTQLAAEAMEALHHGADLAISDVNDANQGTQDNPKGAPDSSRERKTKNRLASEQPSSKKRRPSDLGVFTRQSKKAKRIIDEVNMESPLLLQKGSKNVKKQCESQRLTSKQKRAALKTTEQASFKGIGKNSSKITKKRSASGTSGKRNFVKSGESNCAATLSGDYLVKDQCLNTEVGFSTPIACRTRQSKEKGQLQRAKNVSVEYREDFEGVGVNMDKVNGNSQVEPCKLLNGRRQSSKLGCTESGEHDFAKPNENKQLDHKLIAIVDISKINAMSYPRRRRSHRILKRRVSLQSLDEPFLACNTDDMNGKVMAKTCLMKSTKHSEGKSNADSSFNTENTKANPAGCESPIDKSKRSGSACTTPVNCKTPVNNGSPVCMDNEYFKRSCKKNLSRSRLIKELIDLSAASPECITPSKDSRKRRDMADVRVLYSHHLDDDIIKQQKKILVKLGVSAASSIRDATHFITDKFVRTRNMLEAIASGKPVVTHLWLESCGQACCFIDEKKYILRDAKKEKEFGFSMPISLARAYQHPLLQGRKVLITPNVKPGKEIVSCLVKAVHGQPLERIGRSSLKDEHFPDDLLVLSSDEDYTTCLPFLEKGATIYSSELLLNGIVTQKLEYERHRLFADRVKKTRSSVWLRTEGNKYQPVTKHK